MAVVKYAVIVCGRKNVLRTSTAAPATMSPTRTSAATAVSLVRGIRESLSPPILPPNVQPGHRGIPLYGQGISDRGTGDG